MNKQVFTTSSPLVRKNTLHGFSFDWIPQSIEALGNGVSNSIKAANSSETVIHADVNENQNKNVSFTQIRSLGIALAAAAVIITALVLIFRHKQ